MRKSTRFSCLTVFTLVFLGFLGCNHRLNGDLTSVPASKVYTVEQLISEFQSNQQTDTELVIAVEGIVHEINNVNDRHTILLEGDTASETYVICDMNTNQLNTTEAVKSGDSILVKGLLKGILKDVIMLNCVVIKTE